MRILIAVPTFENISPDTFKSIYDLDKDGHYCTFEFFRGYDCARARNSIARAALEQETDYVLMVDSDMVIPQNALRNLLNPETDVCLGYCAHRNAANVFDGKTTMYRKGEFDFTQMYDAVELRSMQGRGIYRTEIHGGGLPCAMIRTEVFRKLPYPWFDWTNYVNGSVLSEDLYFCVQCKNAGIPVFVDTRVGCGHIMRYTQWV